jgi:hypothetical protein
MIARVSRFTSFLLFGYLEARKSLKRSYIYTYFLLEGRKATNSFTDLDTFFWRPTLTSF